MTDEKVLNLDYDKSSAMQIAHNHYQGSSRRILCVCSAGILRSATTAVVLSQDPFNFNTRAAGVKHYALIPVTDVLMEWAQEIVCMTGEHEQAIRDHMKGRERWSRKPIWRLDIPDIYEYRQDELIALIKESWLKHTPQREEYLAGLWGR